MSNIEKPIVQFGTSGLRGPAVGFTVQTVAAYVSGFIQTIVANNGPRQIFVASDLRKSSPHITHASINAIAAQGWEAIYGGNVPTPAIAGYAMIRNCPSIMVTGSHIPESFNGIKFYRREGELLKEDEAPIREYAQHQLQTGYSVQKIEMPKITIEIARAYVQRLTSTFGASALKGMRIGVDLHSAVGRDLLIEVIEALGANCFDFGRATNFVAVDTEALSHQFLLRAKSQISQHDLDCVISTDGDGDRPLLIDENATQINGDILGALSARALGIKTIVTPLSSTSAIEKSGWFNGVIRTKIGSPYVVAEMNSLSKSDKIVAGFEANGGFLLGSDLNLENGCLRALPTRDAFLPLVAVLAMSNRREVPVSSLSGDLPRRFMKSGLIKNIPAEVSRSWLYKIQNNNSFRRSASILLSEPTDINLMDGVRMTFANDTIIHFRPSGNGPELRIYVETADPVSSKNTLTQTIEDIHVSLKDEAENE